MLVMLLYISDTTSYNEKFHYKHIIITDTQLHLQAAVQKIKNVELYVVFIFFIHLFHT